MPVLDLRKATYACVARSTFTYEIILKKMKPNVIAEVIKVICSTLTNKATWNFVRCKQWY